MSQIELPLHRQRCAGHFLFCLFLSHQNFPFETGVKTRHDFSSPRSN
jgi:hypothetical protein